MLSNVVKTVNKAEVSLIKTQKKRKKVANETINRYSMKRAWPDSSIMHQWIMKLLLRRVRQISVSLDILHV